jgi:glycosyltransferase involved in cell wall biosynthesis
MSGIDIIVTCYNYGRFLRRCVESVLEQSHRDMRVLIIDDASTDDTPAIAAELINLDPRVSLRRRAVNRGHIPTYNEGIEWAQNEYMLLLSADDFLLPGALARAIAVLDFDPEVGLVWGSFIAFRDGEPVPVGESSAGNADAEVLDPKIFISNLAVSNCIHTATAVVRTSVQKRLGGYLPELPHAGDLEMWVRFALYSKVARVKTIQAVYRQHDSNMSLAYPDSLNFEQCRRVFRMHYREIGARLPQGAKLEFWIRQRYAFLGIQWAKLAWTQGKPDTCRKMLMDTLEEVP